MTATPDEPKQGMGASADADRAFAASPSSPSGSGPSGLQSHCAAFTPGPWFSGKFSGDGPLCVQTIDPLGAWICGQLHNPPGAMSYAEAEANARLIASAPCMAAFVRKQAEAGSIEALQLWERINGRG